MKNKPEKIYLNLGTNTEVEDFKTLSEVTWCEDKVNDDDLEFVSVSFLFDEIHKRIIESVPSKENALEIGKKILFLENFRKELKNLIK